MINRGCRPLEEASSSLVRDLTSLDQAGQEFNLEGDPEMVAV